jgi:hypothetical protein
MAPAGCGTQESHGHKPENSLDSPTPHFRKERMPATAFSSLTRDASSHSGQQPKGLEQAGWSISTLVVSSDYEGPASRYPRNAFIPN